MKQKNVIGVVAWTPPPATAEQRYEQSPYRHYLLLQLQRGIGLLFGMSIKLKTDILKRLGSESYLKSSFVARDNLCSSSKVKHFW
jgi:hypothetical protein